MVGLDKALEGWLETVASISDLTPAEQAKITTAGAKVFQKELEEVTREKHYSIIAKVGPQIFKGVGILP